MHSTLRAINEQILDLTADLIEAEDAAEENAILEALDALTLKREQKLENIAYVRLEQKSDVKAIDAEIKRLQAKKQAIDAAGRRLDTYVMTEMQQAGIKSHKGQLANLTIAKSPVSCEVVDESAIPDEFIQTVTETKIKKSDALRHFKNTGEVVAGMRFYHGEHLRIK